jgi:hypothetical protein
MMPKNKYTKQQSCRLRNDNKEHSIKCCGYVFTQVTIALQCHGIAGAIFPVFPLENNPFRILNLK